MSLDTHKDPINSFKWSYSMEKDKIVRFPKKKRTSFQPDRNYIKNAMEEYKNRGGRIEKQHSNGSYYNNVIPEANLFTD